MKIIKVDKIKMYKSYRFYAILASFALHLFFVFVLFLWGTMTLEPSRLQNGFNLIEIALNESRPNKIDSAKQKQKNITPPAVMNSAPQITRHESFSEFREEPLIETSNATDFIAIEATKNTLLSEREKYLLQLRSKIQLAQIYPKFSRLAGEHGVVQVELILDRAGSIQKIEVRQESPFRRLNEAALSAVTRAAPFDPFPDQVTASRWQIIIPIKFSLRNE